MAKICNKHLSEPAKIDIECVGCELEQMEKSLNNIIKRYEEEKKVITHFLIMLTEEDSLETIKQYGNMARKILSHLESEKARI